MVVRRLRLTRHQIQTNFLTLLCNCIIRSPRTLDVAANESDQNAVVCVDRVRTVEPAKLRIPCNGFRYGNLLLLSLL